MPESLNSAVDLHDSIVGSISNIGTAIQNFVLEIDRGQIEGQVGTLPAEVYHGASEVETEISENVCALPIDARGPVALTLHLAPDNRRICKCGERLTSRAISDPEYVEAFTP